MMNIRSLFLLICWVVVICAAPAARAQWAVIDVQAIARLMQQVQTMQQSLATAKAQLIEAQLALRSMSGGRGMERLLYGTARNYLPGDWPTVQSLAAGVGGSYAALSGDVGRMIADNAVLPSTQVATLAPAQRQKLAAARQHVALRQALFRNALTNASERFAAIQTLIDAIPAAGDQKGILDLQARIGAEQGMLQDEQTKMIVLSEALRAEGAALRQQQREAVVVAHGRFETRFRPVP